MKIIFSTLFAFLLICCNQNKKSENIISDNDDNRKCIDKYIVEFNVEDYFSSEGNEGKIYFTDDTLFDRVDFSYATSMFIVNEKYEFVSNKLFRYKKRTSYLNENKSGYLREHSVNIVTKEKIINDSVFDKELYKKIIKLVSDENPCIKSRI